jgi:transposase InsO family protein
MILEGCHKDCCGGHFAGDSTARKALISGYSWPNLFKDAHRYTRHCDPCQRVGRPTSSSAMPLVPILAQAPFEKWRIDFVGPIAHASRNGQKQYILVSTEYVTKWAEDSAVRSDNASTVAKFLYENIITRFGCPKGLVSDQGTHFINSTIQALTDKYDIKHRKTTPYHPRPNGQTEKTNGILCKILTKTIMGIGTDWDTKLFAALWAYRTAYKVTTQSTPFQLVYGTEAILPIELEIPSLRIAIRDRLGDTESLQQRLTELEKLDEIQANAFLVMEAI